jgi:micrococcal nuclease
MDLLLSCVDKDIDCFSLEGQKIQAKITNVYDADTCRAVFYLDNKLVKYTVRLKGIDTPEIRPKKSVEFRDEEIKAAKKSRNRFIQLCTDQTIEIDKDYKKRELQSIIDKNRKLVILDCHEFDKYGRLLATIYEDTDKTCFNNVLIEEGYAYAYDGGTKQKFKPK